MSITITAIYEKGVLRPLTPLTLPEHSHVQLQIVEPSPASEAERQHVRQVLIDAGIIRPRPATPSNPPVPEADLTTAAESLGTAGPLSELIIAEREG